MKKLFITLAAALMAVSASAQIRIELSGAYGCFISNGYFNTPWVAPIGGNRNVSSGMGFDARVYYDIPIAEAGGSSMYIEPGIGYLMNNSDVKSSNAQCRLQWLQVPVYFGTDVPLGNVTFTSAIGLYYGYALSGKCIDRSENISYDLLTPAEGTRILKRNDFGFGLKAGVIFGQHFGLYVGYNRGFIDISDHAGLVARSSIFRFGIQFKL